MAQRFDGAGVLTLRGADNLSGQDMAYDFKGNSRINVRRMLQDAEGLADWSGAPVLGAESFTTRTDWDALNRPRAATTPDGTVTRPGYDAGARLKSLTANLQGAAAATPVLNAVAYNARGQRMLAVQGNGAQTRYDYDPQTFRLAQLLTTRSGFAAGQNIVQRLSYTDDPVGNISHVQDDADIQNVVYFRNRRVEPSADYRYDAIYRLVSARGREHLGQLGGVGLVPGPASYNDAPRVGLPHPGDGNAMGTYLEQYGYDAAGNLLQVRHAGSDPANPGWTRSFMLAETSQIEAGRTSNRLTRSVLGANGNAPQNEDYVHDPHGNMTRMPQLQRLEWDFQDRLRASQRQAVNADDADGALHRGERSLFVYDGSGQRLRKLTLRANGTRMKERLYLGSFEVYREYDGRGNAVTLERQTLHLMDGSQRVALVETRTSGDDGTAPQLMRFVYGNHLGSASLELDAGGRVISYEEYHPFGTTSYQAVDATLRAAAKRYRFSGLERDEETGLDSHQQRYCAPWLGRWIHCDPDGLVDGPNLYRYARNAPTMLTDRRGTDPDPIAGGTPAAAELQAQGQNGSFANAAQVQPEGVKTSEFTWQGFGAYGTPGGSGSFLYHYRQVVAPGAELGLQLGFGAAGPSTVGTSLLVGTLHLGSEPSAKLTDTKQGLTGWNFTAGVLGGQNPIFGPVFPGQTPQQVGGANPLLSGQFLYPKNRS